MFSESAKSRKSSHNSCLKLLLIYGSQNCCSEKFAQISMYAQRLPPSLFISAASISVNHVRFVLPEGARPSKYPAGVSSARYPVSVKAGIF